MKLEQRHAADEKNRYKRSGVKGVLFRALPDGAYDYLRGANLRFKQSSLGASYSLARAKLYESLAESDVLSGVYYAFASRTFDREHKGTLAAKSKYLRDVYTGEGNVYALRRNVHKLEKGLIMKPRRDIFGIGYLRETVDSFADCASRHVEGKLADQGTISWSQQVLEAYFAAVTASHPTVDECRAVFEAAKLELEDPQARVPFARPSGTELPTFEALMRLAQHRRSVRWFDGRPVPREIVDRAVTLAGLSPSACNRQPFRFAIYDDPELCQKVGSIPKGTPGWIHNIPCFIVIVGTLEAFDREKDRHIPYIDGSLAAMSLCFALECQGVSTCCVNWPDLPETERRMAEVLGLSRWERPIMCLAVGYPDMAERVPYSQKLPLEKLRSYNQVSPAHEPTRRAQSAPASAIPATAAKRR